MLQASNLPQILRIYDLIIIIQNGLTSIGVQVVHIPNDVLPKRISRSPQDSEASPSSPFSVSAALSMALADLAAKSA